MPFYSENASNFTHEFLYENFKKENFCEIFLLKFYIQISWTKFNNNNKKNFNRKNTIYNSYNKINIYKKSLNKKSLKFSSFHPKLKLQREKSPSYEEFFNHFDLPAIVKWSRIQFNFSSIK